MVIIALFSFVATVVAYGVTIKTDVDYLKTAVDEHPAYQELTNERLLEQGTAIVINQEKIIAIHDDLTEIKADIKELISR